MKRVAILLAALGAAIAIALGWRARAVSESCVGCNVVLVTFDTLRADHLGVYGYAKPTSPSIDAFASRATVYARNVSQAGSTLSSIPSLHTSKLPHSDRLLQGLGVLTPSEDTLAEILDRHDYTTMAVIAHTYAQCRWGACQGFEFVDDQYQAPEPAQGTLARVTKMLDAHARQPFYLWVHFRVPHDPYDPGQEAFEQFYEGHGTPRFYAGPWATLPIPMQLQRLARKHRERGLPEHPYTGLQAQLLGLSDDLRGQIVALYDGGILQGDRAFGALLGWLESRRELDRTVVVVAADHGEALGERGHMSHNRLDYAILHTPLIVFVPGASGRVVEAPSMNLDILPTVLGALGLPIPERIRGMDLSRRDPPPDRPVTAEYQDGQTIIRWPLKLTRRDGGLVLHDVARDPAETKDLSADRRAETRALDALLTQITSASVASEADRPDTDVIEKLRTLGYIEEGKPSP